MVATRTPRETETRAASEREKVWQPASTLPEPNKQDGYDYRWVRTAFLSKTDPTNLSSKMREGWEPVRIEEQEHFRFFLDPDSRFKDNIEVGGLLLCKAPYELMAQRRRYFSNQAEANMEAVNNNFMRENDPRMPLFSERKSKTSFGTGS